MQWEAGNLTFTTSSCSCKMLLLPTEQQDQAKIFFLHLTWDPDPTHVNTSCVMPSSPSWKQDATDTTSPWRRKGSKKLLVLSCAGVRAVLAPWCHKLLFPCICLSAGPFLNLSLLYISVPIYIYICWEGFHPPKLQGLGLSSWCFVCPFFIYASLLPRDLQQGCRVTFSTFICIRLHSSWTEFSGFVFGLVKTALFSETLSSSV